MDFFCGMPLFSVSFIEFSAFRAQIFMQISYLTVPLIQKPEKPFAENFWLCAVEQSGSLCIENSAFLHKIRLSKTFGWWCVLCIKYPINWG